MSESFIRRHARFLSKERVEVRSPSREDFQSLWTKDISKGGLFVETDDPPPVRSRVEVRLQTREGAVDLMAEVVHVLDAATAQSLKHPPGAGLQFLETPLDVRKRIEQYIEGTIARLDKELVVSGADLTADLLETAKSVLNAINKSQLYIALQVEPKASMEDIMERAETLQARLTKPPKGVTPPQAARLDSVARQINRVSKLLTNTQKRLQYDFRHDQVRAEDRIIAAEAHEGPSVDELRKEWSSLFPDRIEHAKEQARFALQCEDEGKLEAAIESGEKALELDPFNLSLRDTLSEWRERLNSSG